MHHNPDLGKSRSHSEDCRQSRRARGFSPEISNPGNPREIERAANARLRENCVQRRSRPLVATPRHPIQHSPAQDQSRRTPTPGSVESLEWDHAYDLRTVVTYPTPVLIPTLADSHPAVRASSGTGTSPSLAPRSAVLWNQSNSGSPSTREPGEAAGAIGPAVSGQPEGNSPRDEHITDPSGQPGDTARPIEQIGVERLISTIVEVASAEERERAGSPAHSAVSNDEHPTTSEGQPEPLARTADELAHALSIVDEALSIVTQNCNQTAPGAVSNDEHPTTSEGQPEPLARTADELAHALSVVDEALSIVAQNCNQILENSLENTQEISTLLQPPATVDLSSDSSTSPDQILGTELNGFYDELLSPGAYSQGSNPSTEYQPLAPVNPPSSKTSPTVPVADSTPVVTMAEALFTPAQPARVVHDLITLDASARPPAVRNKEKLHYRTELSYGPAVHAPQEAAFAAQTAAYAPTVPTPPAFAYRPATHQMPVVHTPFTTCDSARPFGPPNNPVGLVRADPPRPGDEQAPIGTRILWPKYRAPPPFHGASYEDVLEWVRQYEAAAGHNGWTDPHKVLMLESYLQGAAAKWWKVQKDILPVFWDDQGEQKGLKTALLKTYLTCEYAGDQRGRLMNRRFIDGEPIQTYIYDVLDLCAQVNPDMTAEEKIAHLDNGLSSEVKSYMLPYRDRRNVNEYTDQLRLQAEACRMRRLERPAIALHAVLPAPQVPPPPTSQDRALQLIMEQLRDLSLDVRRRPNAEPRWQPTGQYPPQNSSRDPSSRIDGQLVCYNCGKVGHMSRNCKSPRKQKYRDNPVPTGTQPRQPAENRKQSSNDVPILCLNPSATASDPDSQEVTVPDGHGTLMVQEMLVNGFPVKAMIDSASALTVISLKVLGAVRGTLGPWNGPRAHMVNNEQKVLLAGSQVQIAHPKGVKADVYAAVMDCGKIDLLVGTNTLKAMKYTVTWDEQVTSIPGHPIVRGLACQDEARQRRRYHIPPATAQFNQCATSTMVAAATVTETRAEPIKLVGTQEEDSLDYIEDWYSSDSIGETDPNNSCVDSMNLCELSNDEDDDRYEEDQMPTVWTNPVQVYISAIKQEKDDWLPDDCRLEIDSPITVNIQEEINHDKSTPDRAGQAKRTALTHPGEGSRRERLRLELDPNWEDNTPPGTPVYEEAAFVETEWQDGENLADAPSDGDSVASVEHDFEARICPTMPPEHVANLKEILQEYRLAFARDSLELGSCMFTTHRIDTQDAKPIKQRAYPNSYYAREKIRRHVHEMELQRIIERSQSPWSSPVLLVKKKDDTWRFCVDYRKLNAVTVKDVYPLPRIEDALSRLQGAKVFSSLDLQSGYWQVPVAEEDKEKTAFITEEGLWQFRVMPFGLCNAPGTFQRMMDTVLGDERFTSCLVYLDDIIVYGRSYEEHQERLALVLRYIDAVGLKIKLKKCTFGQKRLSVLGHVVSAQGVEPDPEKIKAVAEFPLPPMNATEKVQKKHIMSYLGLCSYYRRFVPKFADMARPLHQLTKKDQPFEWSEAANASFEQLRAALLQATVLAYPEPEQPMEIHPDASDYGLGAVLVQTRGGVQYPIAYASRLMNKCERNYSVTEKECLALVWSLQKFRQYVWGGRILIYTDHVALTWLMTKKDLAGRLARWSLQVQEHDIKILYKKGKLHTDADALSRYPVDQPEEMDGDYRVFAFAPARKKTPRSQLKKEQRLVAKWADRIEQLENFPNRKPKNYEMRKGLLCKRIQDGRRLYVRVCIPPGEVRKAVLLAMHDDKLAGHLGLKKTLQRMRQRYYWPKMQRSVERYVASCQACQGRKTSGPPRIGRLIPIMASKPFERIGMDVLGPFKKSAAGNTNILVAIDYFTKYAETKAVPNADAQTVADFFVEQILLRHGAPEYLLTDMGRCFTNQLMRSVCAALETNYKVSSPYHPQTNGQVERLNRTLADMLSMYVDQEHTWWDESLPYITFAYNTARQESTQHTPYFLTHGREPRLPLDIQLGVDPNSENWESHGTSGKLHKQLHEALEWVKKHLPTVQQAYKNRYDEGRVSVQYWKGDLVLLWKPKPRPGLTRKLNHYWHGPYEVIKQLTPLSYEVQDCLKKKISKTHVSLMKPYRMRGRPSEQDCENFGNPSKLSCELAAPPMPPPEMEEPLTFAQTGLEDNGASINELPSSPTIEIPLMCPVGDKVTPTLIENIASISVKPMRRKPARLNESSDPEYLPTEMSMIVGDKEAGATDVLPPNWICHKPNQPKHPSELPDVVIGPTRTDDELVQQHANTPEKAAILRWLLEVDPNFHQELLTKTPAWYGNSLQGLRYYDRQGKKILQRYPVDPQDPQGLHRENLSLRTRRKWGKILTGRTEPDNNEEDSATPTPVFSFVSAPTRMSRHVSNPTQAELLRWLLTQDPTLQDELRTKDIVWRNDTLVGLRSHYPLTNRSGNHLSNLEQYPRVEFGDEFTELSPSTQGYWQAEFNRRPKQHLFDLHNEWSQDEQVVNKRAEVLRWWFPNTPQGNEKLNQVAVRWQGPRSYEFDLLIKEPPYDQERHSWKNSSQSELLSHHCRLPNQREVLSRLMKEDFELAEALQDRKVVWGGEDHCTVQGLQRILKSGEAYGQLPSRFIEPYPRPRLHSLRVRARAVPKDTPFWTLGLHDPGLVETETGPVKPVRTAQYPDLLRHLKDRIRDRMSHHHHNEYEPGCLWTLAPVQYPNTICGNYGCGLPKPSLCSNCPCRIADQRDWSSNDLSPDVGLNVLGQVSTRSEGSPEEKPGAEENISADEQTDSDLDDNESDFSEETSAIEESISESDSSESEARMSDSYHGDTSTSDSDDLRLMERNESSASSYVDWAVPSEEDKTTTSTLSGPSAPALNLGVDTVDEASKKHQSTPESEEELARHRYGIAQAKSLARVALKKDVPPEQRTETAYSQERTSNARQTSKIGGKLYATLMALTLLMLFEPVEASTGTILTRSGVYFREGAQVSIGDSYWTIVTELETASVRQQVLDLISRVATDTWYQADVVLPVMQERVVENREIATSRLNQALARYDALMGALHTERRVKRSPLDVVGSTMQWLFGIATTEDITELNHKLTASNTKTDQVLHLVTEQATLVNESLWETKRTAETLQHVVKELDQLEKRMLHKQNNDHGRTHQCEQYLDRLHAAVAWYEEYVDTLGISMTSLSQGRVSPLLFPPDNLRHVLDAIQRSLPRGWALTSPLQDGELWHIYRDAVTNSVRTNSGMRLFVRIPIVETRHVLTLYQIFTVPIAIGNGSSELRYEPLPTFLAAAPDRQMFAELSKEEVGSCAATGVTTCTVYTALNPILSKRSCAIALFMDDANRQKEDCLRTTRPWSGHKTVYLGDGRWIYTSQAPQRFTFSCAGPVPHVIQRTLPSWGLVIASDGCTVSTDLWSFPNRLRGQADNKKPEALRSANFTQWPTLTRYILTPIPDTLGQTQSNESRKKDRQSAGEEQNDSPPFDSFKEQQRLSQLLSDNSKAIKHNEQLVEKIKELNSTTTASDPETIIIVSTFSTVGVAIIILSVLVGWKLRPRRCFENPNPAPIRCNCEYIVPPEPLYDTPQYDHLDPALELRQVATIYPQAAIYSPRTVINRPPVAPGACHSTRV